MGFIDYILNFFILIKIVIKDYCLYIYNSFNKNFTIYNISLNNKNTSETIENYISKNEINWHEIEKKKDNINENHYILVKYELFNTKYNLIIPHNINLNLDK